MAGTRFAAIALLSLALAAACADDDDAAPPGDDLLDDDVTDDDADDDVDDDAEGTCAPLDCVNVFVGTGEYGFAIGQTHPGASVPHGVVKVGPDTSQWDFVIPFYHCAGYFHPDRHVRMFSHTRVSGIGVPDLGAIGFMPTLLRVRDRITEADYRQRLDHSLEGATAGYYALTLPDTGIRVELAATGHAAYHRYTFPRSPSATIVIDTAHLGAKDGHVTAAFLTIDPAAREVAGFANVAGGLSGRFGGMPTYFVARFAKPFTSYGIFQAGATRPDEVHGEGTDLGGWVTYSTREGEAIDLKVGISYISVEQARANLEAEIPGWDLYEVADAAAAAWEEVLARIEIEGGRERDRRIFYSAMYHAFLHPTDLTEAGGVYPGFDRQVHTADGFRFVSDLSLWDTFRTAHPLYDLIARDLARDVLVSLVRMYEQSGAVPRWPMGIGDSGSMVGTPADDVVAGSYLKGIIDFDVETIYEGLYAHATGPFPSGRGGIEDYLALGYVAADHHGGSVSETLEYCVNDHGLSRLAEALGKEEDAAMFRAHSGNYRNHFNPDTGFLQGRNADGSWLPMFPLWPGDEYVEGNAWQYLFYVPHDFPGLAALMGGNEAAVARLDHFFEHSTAFTNRTLPNPYYWHGNEPDIHAAYMYDLVGSPDRTQRWVSWIRETRYTDGPDGLDGNDDVGTLSAWYIFSALGFYPMPGDDLYLVGTPLFPKAVLRIGDQTLTIIAENAARENIFVQSATLNGEPLAVPWFRHADIAGGGEIRFVMGPQPSNWGRTP